MEIRVPITMSQKVCGIYIDDYLFSTRTANALRRNGIKTIGDLIEKHDTIGRIKGLGKGCISEINSLLFEIQVSMLDDVGLDKYIAKLKEVNA